MAFEAERFKAGAQHAESIYAAPTNRMPLQTNTNSLYFEHPTQALLAPTTRLRRRHTYTALNLDKKDSSEEIPGSDSSIYNARACSNTSENACDLEASIPMQDMSQRSSEGVEATLSMGVDQIPVYESCQVTGSSYFEEDSTVESTLNDKQEIGRDMEDKSRRELKRESKRADKRINKRSPYLNPNEHALVDNWEVLRTQFMYGQGTPLDTITERNSDSTLYGTLRRSKSVPELQTSFISKSLKRLSCASTDEPRVRKKPSKSMDDIRQVNSLTYDSCVDPKEPLIPPPERPVTPPGLPSWDRLQKRPSPVRQHNTGSSIRDRMRTTFGSGRKFKECG